MVLLLPSKPRILRPSGDGSTAPEGRTAMANSNSMPKVRRSWLIFGMPARGKSTFSGLGWMHMVLEGKVINEGLEMYRQKQVKEMLITLESYIELRLSFEPQH